MSTVLSDDRRDVGGPVVIVVAAFLARLVPVLRGGGLFGAGNYDDGVHFAAALGLVNGRLPYRDFLLLHPPGIVIALAPFAALARLVGDPQGFAVARLAFMALGATSALLVWQILRRLGRPSAVVGAVGYAVFSPAVYAEHSTLLEGLGSSAVLVAVLIMTRLDATVRRPATAAVLAGAMLGLSASTKVWGVVPAAVMITWSLVVLSRRRGLQVLAGVGLGATAVCLPFFAAAPDRMWRYVVLDQLGRPHTEGAITRVRAILGVHAAGATGAAAIVLTAAVVVLAAALAWRGRTGRLAVLLLVADVGLLLTTPPFFPHYAELAAAPLVLVLGAAVPPVAARLHRRRARIAAVAAMSAVAVLAAVPTFGSTFGRTLPTAALTSTLQGAAGCTTTDDPITLIETNALTRDVRRGCPLVVDLGGYNYDLQPPGGYRSRRTNAAWQQHALTYLRSGSLAIVFRFSRQPGFTPSSRHTVHSWPVVARVPSITVRAPS